MGHCTVPSNECLGQMAPSKWQGCRRCAPRRLSTACQCVSSAEVECGRALEDAWVGPDTVLLVLVQPFVITVLCCTSGTRGNADNVLLQRFLARVIPWIVRDRSVA